jgi:esterase/lipase superfamily enzyme
MVRSSEKARAAEPVADPSPEQGKQEDFTRVRVFYGTDRNRTGAKAAAKFYGTGRGELELGTCEVGIPKSHEAGQLESPSWWHLEFKEDEKRHVMLRKVEPLDRAKFYEQYQAEIGKARSRDVFVFVHGFNVSFEDSARRTAQLAYDLGFPGVPVMYSWPSQGALSGYMVDEDSILSTRMHLKQFLSDLSAQSQGARIHLIAHSMGNRVLTDAMHDIALANPTPLFSEVILTAPDINADYFKNELAPVIQKIAHRVTLYASSDDKALMASEKAHHSQRAGDSKPNIIVVPGIDTIDASGIDTSLLGLGHSYFAETKVVLDDINLLLTADKPPAERSLREQSEGTGKYWKFSSEAVAAVTAAAIAAQANQSPGITARAGGFGLPVVLLLAVVLVACGVGGWLALRSARRKSA